MRIVKSKLSFENYVNNFLCKHKKTFEIDERLGSKKVIWDKERNFGATYRKPMDKDKLSKSWVFSQIKQSFTRYAKKNPTYEIYLPGPALKKDVTKFKKLKAGNVFLATDASGCYLRMAYNLGYISQKLYDKLCEPEFKLIRNKAMAVLSSKTIRYSYVNGELVNTIRFKDDIVATLYANIRYKSYEVMNNCMIACGKSFLKYKTDCVYYIPDKRKLVESVFTANNMLFETTECMVIDHRYFLEGDKLKKF